MGFTVDKEGTEGTLRSADLRIEAHHALDEILDTIERGEANGGEAIITGHCQAGHTHHNRITFCDWDGQEICAFCHGTGAAKQRLESN